MNDEQAIMNKVPLVKRLTRAPCLVFAGALGRIKIAAAGTMAAD
jgi:hypothetical protein